MTKVLSICFITSHFLPLLRYIKNHEKNPGIQQIYNKFACNRLLDLLNNSNDLPKQLPKQSEIQINSVHKLPKQSEIQINSVTQK